MDKLSEILIAMGSEIKTLREEKRILEIQTKNQQEQILHLLHKVENQEHERAKNENHNRS